MERGEISGEINLLHTVGSLPPANEVWGSMGGDYIQGGWADPTGYYEIRSTRGPHASYWNAFLFEHKMTLLSIIIAIETHTLPYLARYALNSIAISVNRSDWNLNQIDQFENIYYLLKCIYINLYLKVK